MRVRGKKSELAKMLLKYRKDNNLTCKEMAKMLGMEKQQYNRYEHSNALPHLFNIKKLINVIGMEEEEMYKILIEENKKAIQVRSCTALKNADISEEDLLKIIMILQKYYNPEER